MLLKQIFGKVFDIILGENIFHAQATIHNIKISLQSLITKIW